VRGEGRTIAYPAKRNEKKRENVTDSSRSFKRKKKRGQTVVKGDFQMIYAAHIGGRGMRVLEEISPPS